MRHIHYVSLMLVASIVVHVSALAWIQIRAGRVDAHSFASLDCGEYYMLAQNLARHGVFSQDNTPPFSRDTWRTPGYPLFLAAAMLLLGDSPSALIVVQHLTWIAAILLFFALASRHMPQRRAAVAAVILLLEPYHILYASWLLSTTFFSFMLLLTWSVWNFACQRPKMWPFALAGLLAGFLVLIWPGAILIPILLGLGVILRCRISADPSPHHQIATSPLHRWQPFIVFLLAGALPVASWMARNKAVAGHFAISHQSGIVLAYFKATEVELWRQGRVQDRYIETSTNPDNRHWPHKVWEDIDAKLCQRIRAKFPNSSLSHSCDDLRWYNLAQGNKTSHDSFEVSRELAAIGRSMLIESSLSTITCWMMRIGENLVFPLVLAIAPAREAPLQRFKAAAIGGAYAVLTLAAALGLWRARKNWRSLWFPMTCVVALALTTSPQIDPRFRVPMIPLLAFLALLPVRREESE